MKQVITYSVGEHAPPINNRHAWEHVYGGSHYLFNRDNWSVAAPVRAIETGLLDQSDCQELISRGFSQRLPVNYDTTPGWKHPSQPIPLEILSTSHIHYDTAPVFNLVKRLSEDLRRRAQLHYRCYLRIVKVRLVKLSRGFEGEWHRDNFPTGIVKVLVYLGGCSQELGTTQIKIPGQEDVFVAGAPGTFAFFDTNTLVHRALGPSCGMTSPDFRYSMEVTFVPADGDFEVNDIPSSSLISTWPYPTDTEVSFANTAAAIIAGGGRRPTDPVGTANVLRANYASPPKALNIGGGAQFLQPGWANVDGAFGETNPFPVQFDPNTSFGFPAETFDFVYTSHTFEHVDSLTFARLVFEARRVLRRGGHLMIKVPDVQRFITEISAGSVSAGLHRCLCGVQRTWATLGVSFSIYQAVSFLACSAWNSEYSDDIFNDGADEEKPGRYFGPCPGLSDEYLRQLFSIASPGEAARILRRNFSNYQVASKTGWKWGHQNAWSEAELNSDISAFGFSLVTNSRDGMLGKFKSPPQFFRSQSDISLWGLYQKL